MSKLQNKIDFIALVSVNMANANGDPLNGNRPRTDYKGYGEISDVCIKRKIRNRMQDMGHRVFVQSSDRCDDGYGSLSERARSEIGDAENKDIYYDRACSTWIDVRTFGQVFAFKSDKKGKKNDGEGGGDGVSVGVRGPVSIHQAVSVSPVDVQSIQITKSVNGEPNEKKASDTMGTKHFVRFGLYKIKGSVNVQLAEKTGFTSEDADVLKECLRTLFINDASSARPDGSMEVVKLYWWEHNCKDGQYSSAKVHNSVSISLKDGVSIPTSFEDYTVNIDALPGLSIQEIDGI